MNAPITDKQIIDFLKTVSDDSLEESIMLVCEGLEKLTLNTLNVDGDELSEEQKKTLNTQLKQYKNKNINFALKNMTIYTDARQFFYNVKPEVTG